MKLRLTTTLPPKAQNSYFRTVRHVHQSLIPPPFNYRTWKQTTLVFRKIYIRGVLGKHIYLRAVNRLNYQSISWSFEAIYFHFSVVYHTKSIYKSYIKKSNRYRYRMHAQLNTFTTNMSGAQAFLVVFQLDFQWLRVILV